MKHKFKNALLLTAATAACLHVINRGIITASTIKNLLSSSNGTFFDWRFGEIYYRKLGHGKPLVLIHDLAPGSSSYEWNLLEEQLGEHFTVYSLDLLGCGRSDKPNMTYTNYLYVQLISDFIEKVVKEKANVAATGLSASFVIMACNNNPELFQNLLLINPESLNKLSLIPGKRSKMMKFFLDLPIIGTSVYHVLTSRENIEYLFTEKYFFNPFSVSKKMVDTYHESAHRNDSTGKYLISSINGKYVNINIRKALSKINHSIFVIGGEQEENISSILHQYTEINPSIETATISKTKHLPQMEAPDKVYNLMRIFLS